MTNKTDRLVSDLIARGKRVQKKLVQESYVHRRVAAARSLAGRALRLGYQLRRSKFRTDPAYNWGGYMLTDADGRVVLGPSYDASLAQIEAFLGERAVR
ncbi:MAG: hypothetical protein WBH00_12185 [Xanthobacteraceae bacterium]